MHLCEKKVNKRWKRLFILGLCLCTNAIVFTACEKKTIDESMETGKINTILDEENIGIPERIQDNLGMVTIDADVIADGYGNLPVAIIQDTGFDDEDIKRYAEAVFDEGSAEVVLPYKYCSKDFLEDEQAKIKAKIKELGYTEETIYESVDDMYLGYQLAEIETYINKEGENDVRENDGSYQWIDAAYSFDYHGEEDIYMQTCQIKGTIDGRDYAMQFVQMDTSDKLYSLMCIFRIKEMLYAEKLDIFSEPGVQSPLSPEASESKAATASSLTKEEAIGQVEEFVEKLGIESYAVIEAYPAYQRSWHYVSDEILSNAYNTDGYLVYLGREIKGCTIPWVDSYLDLDYIYSIDGGIMAPRQGALVAWVTDNGIERFRYVNPMEISEIATEQSTVMDFEDIHRIASKYLSTQTDECVIDKIELCIGMVRDTEENAFAYIPVWCYGYSTEGADDILHRDTYMISAIDGSIIDARSGYVIQK